jgi:citrate lyase subunit beta/citryl-CoA lyase
MRLRNPLFAPADSPRKIDKALESVADAVILDLEDSVSLSSKAVARDHAAHALRRCDRDRLIVRVNPVDTVFYLADLTVVVPERPAAILLPKCHSPRDLLQLDHQLDVLEHVHGLSPRSIKVLVLATETVGSLRSLSYAGVSDRLVALCFGAEDLAADLGLNARRSDMSYPAPIAAGRAALLLAAAEAQVQAIDTPWPDPKNMGGLMHETTSASEDGFSGKLCIHPNQLSPVLTIFTPTRRKVLWAQSVQRLFAENPDVGVLSLDGRMVDKPHLRLAERILDAAAGQELSEDRTIDFPNV